MSLSVDVIAIDGPVASGKGAVSSKVAQALGFHVLDSGALYRLTAYSVLEQGVDPADEERCAAVAESLDPVFSQEKILLRGKDVTNLIREEKIGLTASKIATFPKVRKALFELQRKSAQAPGLVADGRDMGTVVFPDAQLKVFLTASAEARAKRRYNQLNEKGIHSNIDNLVADLKERDARDMNRPVAPLAPAPDAQVLDSSDLTLEETISKVLEWYHRAKAQP